MTAKGRTENFSLNKSDNATPPFNFSWRWGWIAIYIAFLLICNVAIPSIIYFSIKNSSTLTGDDIIGLAACGLAISPTIDWFWRAFKLLRYRERFGVLNEPDALSWRSFWHLDFTMHLYSLCLITYSIPLTIGSVLTPPLYKFYLFSTFFLVAPAGVICLISLFAPQTKILVPISSDAPGSRMRPAMFYVIEDLGAVDLAHGRQFRLAMNAQYDASPAFRTLMYRLTILWTIGVVVFCAASGLTAGLASFDFGFVWVLFQFFLWLGIWFALSMILVKVTYRDDERSKA